MPVIDDALQRWTAAGVLDEAAAERIRVFEASRDQPTGMRWQVLLALLFGGIMLAAGVSLLVAAHWDELSPAARFTVAMLMVIVLHLGGLIVRPRFDRLAVALHGVGTVAAGAAIAVVGQIFNIQEHWPAAILLWAICALAGWALLRDQVQQTITLLLLPTWIICEWTVRSDGYHGASLLCARMLTVFAAAYLTAFLTEKKKLVFGVLFSVAAVALIVGMPFVADPYAWSQWVNQPGMPATLMVFAWLCIVLLPLLFAWRSNPPAVVPVLVIIVTVILLPHLRDRDLYSRTEPGLAAHALVALVAAFLAGWGVRQRSRAMINYGIVCFGLAVLWFYFSSVIGKLGRSFSLMLLGALFLGGGWLLEKTRRRLVQHIGEAA
jgi:uncharacterized membrane protein